MLAPAAVVAVAAASSARAPSTTFTPVRTLCMVRALS